MEMKWKLQSITWEEDEGWIVLKGILEDGQDGQNG